jgi:hypothetical protein
MFNLGKHEQNIGEITFRLISYLLIAFLCLWQINKHSMPLIFQDEFGV